VCGMNIADDTADRGQQRAGSRIQGNTVTHHFAGEYRIGDGVQCDQPPGKGARMSSRGAGEPM
jgi:hypothetical protein